ncbi:hypothetical protein M514_05995 [Trichuris suis]|uniref:J domain-containing protein n=1 Tax=Trichuris suis TaxID=68888 RepID=A0A085MW36_9BILA|nr:hypothetical protein M514_05995 [Trichuris suis]
MRSCPIDEVALLRDCADSKLYLLELQGRLICHAGNSFAGHPLGGLGFKDDGTPFIVIGRQLLYGEVVDLPKPVVALRKKVPSESGERGFDVVAVMRLMEPADNLLQCLWSMFLMYITGRLDELLLVSHLKTCLSLQQLMEVCRKSSVIWKWVNSICRRVNFRTPSCTMTPRLVFQLPAYSSEFFANFSIPELDPDNYMTLYRRATAYLANGRSKSAIPDLNKVVELKPDFVAARLQRGSILLKQGDLDAAEKDFQTVINRDQSSRDAEENIRRVKQFRQEITSADKFMSYKDYGSAEAILNRLIEARTNYSSLFVSLFLFRSRQCLGAISDIRSATRLVPDNTKAMYKASQFSYMLGNLHDAIEGIRECLKIDPDQRECFTFYKKLKRLVKVHDSVLDASAKEQWKLCLDGTGQMLKQESEVTAVIMLAKKAQCKCLGMVGQLDDAIRVCSEVLEKNPNELPTLLNRAEVYIQNNEFEQAIHDYQKALQIDEDNQAARAGLKKAQNLLKQSKKKDYYKILGVKRNADKATIIKAYRKLAQKWHPDNFDKDEKKKAEERFIDIAAAKEVLTDPDKRAQYDSGVDPLDPEAQQQAHHPFYQYFQGFDAPNLRAYVYCVLLIFVEKSIHLTLTVFDKDEKKKAEERFIDIAAAKEVLTDPDKRAQYDSGVDPLDPEAQQQAHHPFYQYFQGFDAPFDQGGGPFTFKFHFQ